MKTDDWLWIICILKLFWHFLFWPNLISRADNASQKSQGSSSGGGGYTNGHSGGVSPNSSQLSMDGRESTLITRTQKQHITQNVSTRDKKKVRAWVNFLYFRWRRRRKRSAKCSISGRTGCPSTSSRGRRWRATTTGVTWTIRTSSLQTINYTSNSSSSSSNILTTTTDHQPHQPPARGAIRPWTTTEVRNSRAIVPSKSV